MWSSVTVATWRRPTPGWLSSCPRAPTGQSLRLFLGGPLWAQAVAQKHSRGAVPAAGGAALEAPSLCQAPCAQASPASLQPTAVGGSGGALRGQPPAHAPGAPTPPGGILSVGPKSERVAGSIQQCAATCCRPRRAHGRSCSRPPIRSWHSAGEGSQLWLPTAHPLCRKLRLSPSTMLAA